MPSRAASSSSVEDILPLQPCREALGYWVKTGVVRMPYSRGVRKMVTPNLSISRFRLWRVTVLSEVVFVCWYCCRCADGSDAVRSGGLDVLVHECRGSCASDINHICFAVIVLWSPPETPPGSRNCVLYPRVGGTGLRGLSFLFSIESIPQAVKYACLSGFINHSFMVAPSLKVGCCCIGCYLPAQVPCQSVMMMVMGRILAGRSSSGIKKSSKVDGLGKSEDLYTCCRPPFETFIWEGNARYISLPT